MSKRRSIKYCQLDLKEYGRPCTNLSYYDEVISSLQNKCDRERNYDCVRAERVINIQKIVRDGDYVSIIFKSGRYGHVTSLLNRFDGSERPTDKTMDEGEKELTHVCLKKHGDCIIFALEGNKYGVSATAITEYLNNELKNIGDELQFTHSYISTKGFSDIIEHSERIISVDLECDHRNIISDPILDVYQEGMKDTFVLNLKPERKKTISKSKIGKIYEEIDPKGDIRRMRVKLITDSGNEAILDTLIEKVTDHVTVPVDEKGVVNSQVVSAALRERLDAMERSIS